MSTNWRNWMESLRRRPYWQIALAAILLLGSLDPNIPAALAPAQEQGDFLQRQALALKPAARADLEALQDAPRYTLVARLEPAQGVFSGQEQLLYTNTTGQPQERLPFHLLPNAESIYGGGNLDVLRVLDGSDELNTERTSPTLLWVSLAEPLAPGAQAELTLDFQGQTPRRTLHGYGIFNRQRDVTALAGWYPILAAYQDGWQTDPAPEVGDALFAETSLYEVRLTLPEGYDLAATGTVLARNTRDGQTEWHLVSGPAREFALATHPGFAQVLEEQVDGVTLRLYLLPAERPHTRPTIAQQVMRQSFQALQQYYGPYPFSELDLVEVPVTIGGYEFSGMVFVDDNYRTRRSLADYEYIVPHELAHQWFYNLVGNDTINEPWLDEALATYAGALYKEYTRSRGTARWLLQSWEQRDGERTAWGPPVNSSALDFSNWTRYRTTVYTHGALFLEALRGEMGDTAFFNFLHDYSKRYRYKIATTQDFLDMAQEYSDQPLNELYSQWFERP